MKKSLIVFCCLLSCFAYSQSAKDRQATEEEQELMDRSWDCAHNGTVSLKERLGKYPFNKAKAIQIISFKAPVDPQWGDVVKPRLPRKQNSNCCSIILETKTLNTIQIDSLTDILYNYGRQSIYQAPKDVYFIGVFSQCYYPRNGILFLNKKKKIFEFIEICFECERSETSSKKVNTGPECNQKLLLLRNFFRNTGIEFGAEPEPEYNEPEQDDQEEGEPEEDSQPDEDSQ